ncbi:putative outer capsid protein VP5 [Rosellinia necatrix]|uniref:Putative outer capsid protein VP5 n=1 Tax=Rosellinia necatrix TaxID=77044 RepID=A0A1W2TVM5_ROSNE|nr:putative outer capsid protein VP5 [Rosellinia necatrix]
MKAAFLTFFAIGGFIASSIANPIAAADSVEKRQDDDYAELGASLTALLANIQKQTGIINSTLESVPENPTDEQATADAAQIAPQLQAITNLITAVDSSVVKRAVVEARYGKPDLFKTLSLIIYEILGTVKHALFKLGLGKVVIYITPLVLSLKGLIFSLDKVVGGALLAVGAVANELLKTVGLALIGL